MNDLYRVEKTLRKIIESRLTRGDEMVLFSYAFDSDGSLSANGAQADVLEAVFVERVLSGRRPGQRFFEDLARLLKTAALNVMMIQHGWITCASEKFAGRSRLKPWFEMGQRLRRDYYETTGKPLVTCQRVEWARLAA